jgi:hypothetical protein
MTIAMVVIISSCTKVDEPEQEEKILAKIGEVDITVDEFMRRAEMTIRPVYCNRDNNIHKKIILNSLIAEKMLALEAGEITDPDQNRQHQLYIQGRQEQSMREWLLHEEGFEKVQLADSEIQKVFNVAGRTYNIEYFNIASDSIAAIAGEILAAKKERFEVLHKQLWPDEDIPKQTVNWRSQDHPKIMESLFTDGVIKDAVIGPLKIGTDNYIVMKVVGWTDQPAITESARKERWDEVKEKLTETKAFKNYDKYVASIMEGKRLDFDADTFNKLVSLIGPIYIRSAGEKQDLFMNAVFDKNGDNPELNHVAEGLDALLDKSLLRIEDQVWSVRKFKEEIQKHPLVFRKNLPMDTKFAEHYRLAIVDMIRDKYLTEEAYKRGYQNVSYVRRNTQIWQDAIMAQYQKNQYLKSIPNFSDSLKSITIIEDYLNPYINQLQTKYSDQIEVNVKDFNDIQLTRIDMIVLQSNLPFQIMVPGFPQVTTDSNLDYGKQME